MRLNKRLLWAFLLIVILSLCWINSSSISTVLLGIKGTITDGNLIKFSGTAGVGEDAGVAASNVTKNKFNATSAPTVNNDIDEGYTVGSRWYDVTADKGYVCLDVTDGAAIWIEITSQGTTEFTGLTDTPANYTGEAGKYAKVNVGEDALEFDTPAGTTVFTGLTDTPANYTGEGGKYIKVNVGEDALEYGVPAGYTNLTSFVEQTAWRLFYSNADGDVVELALGDDGKYLMSNGGAVAPTWELVAGEANTASNIGSQVEIFKQKTTYDLEFRTLKANSNKITISTTGVESVKESNDTGSGTLFDWVAASTERKGAYWTTTSAYNLSKIKMRTYRVGSPGDIVLEVKATDAAHKPTGAVLATATTNCNSITTDSAGELVSFVLAATTPLSDATEYCWYVGGASLDASNKIAEMYFGSDATIGWIYSTDSGASWDVNATYKMAFQAWGAAANEDYAYFDVVETEMDVINLLSTTTVSFAADADTTLYTVPTGKRCVLTHAIVVAADDAGATTTISIGANGAETDFIPANTLSNLDAQYDTVILQPIPNTTPLKIKSYAAATVIEAQVASQSGVAGNTIYLFGILY